MIEIVEKLSTVVQDNISLRRLASAYLTVKEIVIEMGYSHEIDWQDSLTFSNIAESDFLRESAWVILSSGIREAIIRKKFPDISLAFFQWESARKISLHRRRCRINALRFFNNRRKIDAILHIAIHVSQKGFSAVRKSIQNEGISYVMHFPYMGPVTSYHLLKNIGIQVAKPDRHLTRIANALGYHSPHLMALDIARTIGEKVAVVDLVLWRYATLHSNYLETFSLIV